MSFFNKQKKKQLYSLRKTQDSCHAFIGYRKSSSLGSVIIFRASRPRGVLFHQKTTNFKNTTEALWETCDLAQRPLKHKGILGRIWKWISSEEELKVVLMGRHITECTRVSYWLVGFTYRPVLCYWAQCMSGHVRSEIFYTRVTDLNVTREVVIANFNVRNDF